MLQKVKQIAIPSLRKVSNDALAALNEVGLANILQQLNAKIACSFTRGHCKYDCEGACHHKGQCEYQREQATSAV